VDYHSGVDKFLLDVSNSLLFLK